MKNQEDIFQQLSIPSPCPMQWNQMEDGDEGKFCNACAKTVYDFTNSCEADFMKVYRENNGQICGMFRGDQLGKQHTVKRGFGYRLRFAGLTLLAIMGFSVSPIMAQSSQQNMQPQQEGATSMTIKSYLEDKALAEQEKLAELTQKKLNKNRKKLAKKRRRNKGKVRSRILGCPNF